jgi:ferredoxin
MATGTAIAATIPFVPAWAQTSEIDESKLSPITPPGSKSLKHFKEKCTACHLCVTHCPQQILKPAGWNFGFGYLLKPHMVYKEAYCNYECSICSEVCPNGAILHIGESKKTTQVGIAKFVQERCVVFNDETDCGACSEHCPTQAVRMLPYKDGLRLPHVTPELCVGCGGCEYICPVRPVRAINVVANEVHQMSRKPEEEEMEQIKVDDFGF